MTSPAPRPPRVLGTLGASDGHAIIRLEDRLEARLDDVWAALTEPRRLAAWLGDIEGDLREGGAFRARYLASAWEGNCRVQACAPPHRLQVQTTSAGQPDGVVEVVLAGGGDHTVVVIEDRGMPLPLIAAYGAGNQIHLEDLAAYLAGAGRCDARARWQELHPSYQLLAAAMPSDAATSPGRTAGPA